MNDNDIIKALEYCVNNGGCADCPYVNGRCIDLTQDALDLINRQKAEIERLQKEILFRREYMGFFPKLERDKAIKELAERVKNKFYNYYEGLDENTSKSNYNGETLMYYEVADMIEDCIDSLVKEMTGDQKWENTLSDNQFCPQ